MGLDLQREFLILKKQGDIEIKKARLEAYIEEKSKLIVNSMYTEADENNDGATDGEKNVNDADKDADGNPTGKGVLAKIFGAIKGMIDKIVNTVASLFNGTSASDEILADPNKKVELGYDPEKLSDAAYKQVVSDCDLLKKTCNAFGLDPETVAGTADPIITAAKFVGGMFGLGSLVGVAKNLLSRNKDAKKQVEGAEQIVDARYEKMTTEQRKQADKLLNRIRQNITNNIVEPLVMTFDQIRDNAVSWFSKGIFDADTPEPIKTQYKGLNPDDYVSKDMVKYMKIIEKYDEVKDWIVTRKNEREVVRNGEIVKTKDARFGAKNTIVGINGYNPTEGKGKKYDEEQVKKNFEAFITRVRDDPNHITKSEIENFFGDLKKVQAHKRAMEHQIDRNDAKIQRKDKNSAARGQYNSKYNSPEERRNAERNAELAKREQKREQAQRQAELAKQRGK